MANNNPTGPASQTIGGNTYTFTGGGPGVSSTSLLGGLPSNYKAPLVAGTSPLAPLFDPQAAPGQMTEFGTVPNATQYHSGDEWSLMVAQPPDVILQMKQEMYRAGLLTVKDVGDPYTWDSAAATAYTKVLGLANATGSNPQDALTYMLANPKITGSNTGTVENPGKYLMPFHNPVDVQSAFRNVAQQLTGSEMGSQAPQELQYMQGLEQQASAAKDVAKSSGGQYEAKPTDQGAAEQFLLQNDPSQVQAYGVASRMQDFFNLIGGGTK